MLIVGLDNLDDERTKKLAVKWAQRWVQSNYIAFKETNAMYEKVSVLSVSFELTHFHNRTIQQYLATKLGGHGGGGEYEVISFHSINKRNFYTIFFLLFVTGAKRLRLDKRRDFRPS